MESNILKRFWCDLDDIPLSSKLHTLADKKEQNYKTELFFIIEKCLAVTFW